MNGAEPTELVFEFVSSFGAGLGGNDCGGDYHSDKSEGDQKVMHFVLSLDSSSASVHIWIIDPVRKNLNTTKTG